MPDRPLRPTGAGGRQAARRRNRNTQDQSFTPETGEREIQTQAERQAAKGIKPARPQQVDPVTEFTDSVRATVASASEVIGDTAQFESITDRINRLGNFVSPESRRLTNAEELPVPGTRLTNAEEFPIPGTITANAEDAALYNQTIEADRQSREQTGSAVPRQTQVSGNIGDFKFKSNLLSNYENATYHFRLSVTNSELINRVRTLDDINDLPRILLAETGNSQFYITDVQFDQYPNFDPNHRNQGAFQIDITIKEPNGVDFFDYVYSASVTAGVDKWMLTPYVLELWFYGRNVNTGEVEKIGGKTWTYFCYLTQPGMQVDQGGATYNWQLRPFEQRAYEPDINVTDMDFSVTASTVGGFLDGLGLKLNDSEKEKLREGPLALTQYSWTIISPDSEQISSNPRQWSLVPHNLVQNSQRSVSYTSGANSTTVHIGKGTNLAKLIENIIATTEEGVRLSTGFNNIIDTEVEDPQYEWKYIPAVHPILKYGQYRVTANEYDKDVTYYVFWRRITGPAIGTREVGKVNDPEKQRRRLIELNRTGLLQKRLDYTFTGRNTEVINFDMRFDTLWRAAVGWYGSVYHYESQTTGPKKDFNKDAYQQAVIKKKNLINKYRTAFDRQATEGPATTSPQASQALFNRTRGLNRQSDVSGVELTSEEIRAIADTETRQDERDRLQQDQLRRFKQQANNGPVLRLENIDEEVRDRQARIQISIDQYDYHSRTDVAHLTESDWTPGKTLFSLALHQAYGLDNKDLARIEIEIRGDPYWLGRDNSELYIGDSIDNNILSQNNENLYRATNFLSPDYNEGNQAFLLNFGYPRDPNEDPEQSRNRFASAVYNVVRVVHKFEGGMYTQTISAFRDPLSNPDTIGAEIFTIRSQ